MEATTAEFRDQTETSWPARAAMMASPVPQLPAPMTAMRIYFPGTAGVAGSPAGQPRWVAVSPAMSAKREQCFIALPKFRFTAFDKSFYVASVRKNDQRRANNSRSHQRREIITRRDVTLNQD